MNNNNIKDIANIIQQYSDKHQIYLEVLCDGYKFDIPCFRAYIHYKNIDVDGYEYWNSEDLGAYLKYETAFDVCETRAKEISKK